MLNSMIGNGIKIGTNRVSTETVKSSAIIFPKSLKLNDKGLVISSRTIIGKRKGIG